MRALIIFWVRFQSVEKNVISSEFRVGSSSLNVTIQLNCRVQFPVVHGKKTEEESETIRDVLLLWNSETTFID